jgi:putative FmdB family regulatory protein
LPTYEYACTACGHRLEAVQRFSDDPLEECPECGGALRKVYAPVGIVLKGSGFYKTDSRAASGNGSSKKASETTSGESSGSESSAKESSSGGGESAGSKDGQGKGEGKGKGEGEGGAGQGEGGAGQGKDSGTKSAPAATSAG